METLPVVTLAAFTVVLCGGGLLPSGGHVVATPCDAVAAVMCWQSMRCYPMPADAMP